MIRISLLSAALLLCTSGTGLTQPRVALPDSPDYKGEIRRGPDGKLIVIDKTATRPAPTSALAATLVVGPDETIRTITEAAKLARDGDIVEIRPGEYRGQTAIWTQNDLTIRGSGGNNTRPVLLADGKSAEGKGLWVIRGGRVRVENLEFRGVRVRDGNGAGIRFERGQLVIHRCAFIDNEMGILTGNLPDLTLEISDSEFADAARHQVDLHHLLYVGAIGRFALTGSRFSNGYRGHLVKSRARENHIRYNLLADGPGGRASFELEFANGGLAYVVGNVFQKSDSADNSVLVSYGSEGPRWPDNALYFSHNTLINDRHAGTFLKVRAEKFPAGVESWMINNLTVGHGDLAAPENGRFEGNLTAQRGELIDYAGQPLRLKPTSPLRGQVRIPGKAREIDLLPDAEFTLPAGTRPVSPSSALAPGAFQRGG